MDSYQEDLLNDYYQDGFGKEYIQHYKESVKKTKAAKEEKVDGDV